MKPPMNGSLHQWKRLQLPTHDQCLNRSMFRNLLPYPPRRRRSLTYSPAIWFMWRASVGWNIHKRTPFRKEEVKGLVESLSSAGVKNIELLEITYEDNLKCFALNERCTQVDGYPVRRGMCFPIDKNTMYLFTHGIAPSVISPNRRYFQGGKSVPLPLKVVKHYGSGDMAQIATEILGLSKMNWNSFGLYSKLPCTIESSNEIARIGWLLSQFEGTLYDYRYFM